MSGVLEGRVALVTGAGSGIGKAIAERFAAEGARVAVSGRRRQPIETVATATGGMAVVGDVSREPDVQAMMAAIDERWGRLDVLVNNAGITGPTAGAEDMDIDAWDETYAINVRGLMLCMKHAIPLLKRQGGSIVNMSSRVGIKPNPYRSCYASTKFAVRGITEAVAHEVGRYGIRVNAVCPGATDTELFRTIAIERAQRLGRDPDEYLKAEYMDTAALGRLVSLDDVVSLTLFLAGDGSRSMTGESVKIDAGRR